jgi:indolepyruvate ferredoxin oxidoreductase beta subunit
METTNIVLCGLGGQGILFMTKVLSQAALDKGFNIMGAETHGMAQRGGSVVSHLRIGEVEGSLVNTGSARFLLSLDESEGYRNLPFLSRGARMYVNTGSPRFPREETRHFLKENEIICRSLPAVAIARELGSPMSLNLALLGYFSAFDEGPITRGDLSATIERISPDRVKANNLQVFDAGLKKGLEERET